MARLTGEALLAVLLKEADIPFIREHKFHPKRRWRFDFALALPHPWKIAIEVEGGIWSGGRHTRAIGYSKDCEKYNAATVLGWSVLRYPATEIGDETINQIQQLIANQRVVL